MIYELVRTWSSPRASLLGSGLSKRDSASPTTASDGRRFIASSARHPKTNASDGEPGFHLYRYNKSPAADGVFGRRKKPDKLQVSRATGSLQWAQQDPDT